MWEFLLGVCVVVTVVSFFVICVVALDAQEHPVEHTKKVEAYRKNNHIVAKRVGKEIGRNLKIPAKAHRARR
jgi:hypothetical protein